MKWSVYIYMAQLTSFTDDCWDNGLVPVASLLSSRNFFWVQIDRPAYEFIWWEYWSFNKSFSIYSYWIIVIRWLLGELG